MNVFPAAGFIAMAIQAAVESIPANRKAKSVELRDMLVQRPLLFQDNTQGVETRVSTRPHKMGTRPSTAPWTAVSMFSRSMIDRSWNEHASCLFIVHYESQASEVEGITEETRTAKRYQDRYLEHVRDCTSEVSSSSLYTQMEALGIAHGPLFQNLSNLYSGPSAGRGTVTIADTAKIMPKGFEYPHVIHPITLDNIIQLCAPALKGAGIKQMMLPSAMESILISLDIPSQDGTELVGYSKAGRRGVRETLSDTVVSQGNFAAPLVVIKGMFCTGIAGMMGLGAADVNKAKHVASEIFWKEDLRYVRGPSMNEIFSEQSSLTADDLKSEAQEVHALNNAAAGASRRLLEFEPKLAAGQEESAKAFFDHLRGLFTGSDNGAASSGTTASKLKGLTTAVAARLEGRECSFNSPYLSADLNALPSSKKTISKLVKLVDIEAFKHPSFNILEMNAANCDLTATIIERLSEHSQTLRIQKYIHINTSLDRPKGLTGLQKTNPGIVEYKDWSSESEDPICADESLDFVLSANGVQDLNALQELLNHTQKLLKSGGRISTVLCAKFPAYIDFMRASSIFLGAASEDKSDSLTFSYPWNNLVQEEIIAFYLREGFDNVEIIIEASTAPLSDESILITPTKMTTPAARREKVHIIEPKVHSSPALALISNLECGLTKGDHQVTRSKLLDTVPDGDTYVIACLDLAEPTLNKMSAADFEAWRNVLLTHKGLLWLSVGAQISSKFSPEAALITGALRTVRSEAHHLRSIHLDLSEELSLESDSACALIMQALEGNVLAPENASIETELVERNGKLLIPRLRTQYAMNEAVHYEHTSPAAQKQKLGDIKGAVQLAVGTPGMLDTLRFVEIDRSSDVLGDHMVKVKVAATPINFVDIMIAMGMVPSMGIGCECAGTVIATGPNAKYQVGDEVVALTSHPFASHVIEHDSLLQKIPPGLSAVEAASAATIYVTAYVALFDVGRIQKGESVLIHAAAGGLGQAAIQLCQVVGAEIFATVGSMTKKRLLIEKYGIAEDHIFNSRDLTFAQGVMRMTQDKGCDLILNSTNGEALRQTWHCIAPFGRFLEVGKRDIMMNTGLDMAPFLRNTSYAGVHIDQMTGPHLQKVADAMQKVFDLLTAGKVGVVHPVSAMRYEEVEQAFCLVQSGKHTGKIVLTASEEDVVPVVPRKLAALRLSPDVTYVMAGGFGGIGRSITDLMIAAGARNFAFFSRSGDSRPGPKAYMKTLMDRNINARAFCADIGDREHLAKAIKAMEEVMPKAGGFINFAMDLQNMTYQQWERSLAPKVNGSWNFHDLLPKDLDFFVMLASISGMIGTPGQGNYAAANTFQDMLALHRESLGLKATSLDLGAIFGVGHIAEGDFGETRFKIWEMVSLNEIELHAVMTAAMKGSSLVGEKLPRQLVTGVNPAVVNTAHVHWTQEPKFRIIGRARTREDDITEDEAKSKLLNELASCTTLAAAAKAIEDSLCVKLSESLMVAPEDINTSKPLHSFGVDSLVAVEVRNWIFKELRSEVTVFDLMDPQPVSKLVEKTAQRSKLVGESLKKNGASEE